MHRIVEEAVEEEEDEGKQAKNVNLITNPTSATKTMKKAKYEVEMCFSQQLINNVTEIFQTYIQTMLGYLRGFSMILLPA